MLKYLGEQFRLNRYLQILTVIFLIFTIWWASIYFRGLVDSDENTYFTLSYFILALFGGIAGISFARKWGGFKSTLGSSIWFFTLGLLAQAVGQIFYNSYIYFLGIELPYPSVGDVAFFVSVLFYILGAYHLAKISGIKLSMKSVMGKFQALLIPAGILFISYWMFLSGYDPDWSDTAVVFLDFGFPIGQAIFVSIAILALLISKEILGGMMRKPIMLVIFALIVQYIADFTFSYEVSRDLWYAGGLNDYLFALAYFAMSLALFSIGNMFYKVQKS